MGVCLSEGKRMGRVSSFGCLISSFAAHILRTELKDGNRLIGIGLPE